MTEKKIKNIYKYKYIWNIFFYLFFYFIYFFLLLFSGTQLRICVQVATPLTYVQILSAILKRLWEKARDSWHQFNFYSREFHFSLVTVAVDWLI